MPIVKYLKNVIPKKVLGNKRGPAWKFCHIFNKFPYCDEEGFSGGYFNCCENWSVHISKSPLHASLYDCRGLLEMCTHQFSQSIFVGKIKKYIENVTKFVSRRSFFAKNFFLVWHSWDVLRRACRGLLVMCTYQFSNKCVKY